MRLAACVEEGEAMKLHIEVVMNLPRHVQLFGLHLNRWWCQFELLTIGGFGSLLRLSVDESIRGLWNVEWDFLWLQHRRWRKARG